MTYLQVQADFVEQKVRVRQPIASEGNGYKEIKGQLTRADTRSIAGTEL